MSVETSSSALQALEPLYSEQPQSSVDLRQQNTEKIAVARAALLEAKKQVTGSVLAMQGTTYKQKQQLFCSTFSHKNHQADIMQRPSTTKPLIPVLFLRAELIRLRPLLAWAVIELFSDCSIYSVSSEIAL